MTASDRSVYTFSYGVFDLDGTLVDSMEAAGKAFAAQVAPMGIDERAARAFYYSTTGSPVDEQYRRLLREHGVRCDGKVAARLHRGFDYDFALARVAYFDGASRTIRALAKCGLGLFLSSASSDLTVRKRLAEGRVRECFTTACGSTAVPKGPRHLEKFAKAAGVSARAFAADAFFCGDGETDMRLGSSAGLHPIGVLGTVGERRLRRAGARRVVGSVKELLKDVRAAKGETDA